MSIKYELSLWRDYPGENEIREEKSEIIAATGMSFAGRAQNIELKLTYNGQNTLSFDVPVKITDGETGKLVRNELIGKIHNKSKIKLWRDEKWYNPYACKKDGNNNIILEQGLPVFEGRWEQGRWYSFIVTSINEGRGKKKLTHSFSCDNLYVNELSRTGYNLEFVTDTDILASSGIGTAHDLGRKILDGTDWTYAKTETFPDYEERFNAKTGETTKIPVSTDQIEFMKNLNQYGYCYRLKIDDDTTKNSVVSVLTENIDESTAGFEEGEDKDFYFDNNNFHWRARRTEEWKDYVYNYTKTVSNVSIPKVYLGQDAADMWVYKKKSDEWSIDNRVGVNNFDKIDLWKPFGSTPVPSIKTDFIEGMGIYNKYYLELGEGVYYNTGCIDQTFSMGQLLAIKLACSNLPGEQGTNPRRFQYNRLSVKLKVYDNNNWQIQQAYLTAKAKNEDTTNIPQGRAVIDIDFSNTPDGEKAEYPYNNTTLWKNSIDSDDSFFGELNEAENSQRGVWWAQVWSELKNPTFVLEIERKEGTVPSLPLRVHGFYVWDLIAYNDDVLTNDELKDLITRSPGYSGPLTQQKGCILSNLPNYADLSNSEKSLLDMNIYQKGSSSNISYIWCPPGVQGGKTHGADQYLCEFYKNGKYYDIYLPIDSTTVTLEKISSYNADKRRAISGSKSNRYSLLEEVSNIFRCFTRFIINHDNQGKIIGPKMVTFCSELGRNQFNGFTYGVNLSQVNRTADASNLVTKMYVSNIDNEYQDSGIVAIADSSYNKLKENFIYNFEYYLNRNLLNREVFLREYENLVNSVGAKNASTLQMGEELTNLNEEFSRVTNTKSTNELSQKALFNEANEILKSIKWTEKSGSQFPNFALVFKGKDYKTDVEGFATALNKNSQKDNSKEGGGLEIAEIQAKVESVIYAQTAYNNLEDALNGKDGSGGLTNQYNSLKERVETLEANIKSNNEEKNKQLEYFENKYHQFITEGVWSESDYIEPDSYYLDATRAMTTSCMPKVSYKMTVIDLSQLSNPLNPEEKNWGEDFIYDVGDTTYIKDEELFGSVEQKSMVAEKLIHVDTDIPDDLTLQNYETRFEELFQSIAASVTTLSMNENIYSRAANFDATGVINEDILQKSFTQNKNLVISSANNSVIQDNRGITIEDKRGTGEILRAIAGGIYFSKDGGSTYTLGLSAEGISATLITAGQIDTSKIVIRTSDNPLYLLNDLGLTAYTGDGENEGERENRFVRFDRFGVYLTDQGHLFNCKNWWDSVANSVFIESNDTIMQSGVVYYYYSSNDKEYYPLKVDYDVDKYQFYIYPSEERGMIVVGTQEGLYTLDNIIFTDEVKANLYVKMDPNATATEKIQSTSVFSLTREGLKINTENSNNSIRGGSLLLSTKDASLWAYEKAGTKNEPRVRVGYIRTKNKDTSDEKNVYGIDIYNGAFRLYGENYDDKIVGDDSKAALFFDKDRMITTGDIELVFKDQDYGAGTGRTFSGMFGISKDGFYYPPRPFAANNIVLPEDRVTYGPTLFFYTPNVYNPNLVGKPGNSSEKGFLTMGFDTAYLGSGKDAQGGVGGVSAYSPFKIRSNVGLQVLVDHTKYVSPAKVMPSFISLKIIDGNAINNATGAPTPKAYIDMSLDTSSKAQGNIDLWVSGTGSLMGTGSWSSNSALSTSSDISKKHEISPLSQSYSTLFDNLRPVTYKYNDGQSNRYHTGFIAQEVDSAITAAGLTSQDFAGLVIRDRGTENESWYLRYEEFIALNTSEIQKLKARVAELEHQLTKLTSF